MVTLPQTRFYVYLLCLPDDTPFYVGKGSGRRVLRHAIEARRGCECYKCRTIRKLWQDGNDFHHIFAFETDDEAAAFQMEIGLIAHYGRDNLTNLTDGGDGASHLVTDETRAKLRIVLPQVFNTPEAIANRKAGARRRWSDPEQRAQQSERLKAKMTPEMLARKSEGRKAMWSDPATRERLIAAMQAGRKTEKAQQAQRDGTAAAWARRKAKSLLTPDTL